MPNFRKLADQPDSGGCLAVWDQSLQSTLDPRLPLVLSTAVLVLVLDYPLDELPFDRPLRWIHHVSIETIRIMSVSTDVIDNVHEGGCVRRAASTRLTWNPRSELETSGGGA